VQRALPVNRRLSSATLDSLPADIEKPAYDRRAIQTGVVHLGIGAFFRGHVAAYLDEALAQGDLRWGAVGVSLRSAQVRDDLTPQDGLYSLTVRDGSETQFRIVGSVREVLVAPEHPRAVVNLLARPEVHLVTLTVTEKGYKLEPSSGELLRGDADIAADLRDLSAPRSALGFLVAGLAARRAAAYPPFTVLSCDNLSHNGERLRCGVLALARAHDESLAEWISREGAFPCSMVDRIVPAPTPDDRLATARRLGLEDHASIATEPFRQWVVEENFAGPVPDFARLGVTLTGDVDPWEQAKLRLLNGAHSAIAYIGGLGGLQFVHEFVTLPEGAAFIEALWNESAATLSLPRAEDLAAYRCRLDARFRNSALRHRLRQIAMDGSQKLPQRIVAPLRVRRAARQPVAMLTLAVAAWMHWQRGINDRGESFIVEDPLAPQMAERIAGCADAAARVGALLELPMVFGTDLHADTTVRAMITTHLERIESLGALQALRAALADCP
jgi:fructuronate reductase